MLGVRAEHFLQEQQHGRADEAAPDRGDAAEDHHHHQRARLRPVQHVRADVALQVHAQRTGDAAERAGDDEDDELAAVDRKAERLGADVVVAQREHGAAEARGHEAGERDQRQHEDRERDVVERERVLEIEHAVAEREERAGADVEAFVAAVALHRVGEVVQHLRERQRDHDEVDAARAQRDRADDERDQCRDRDRRGEMRDAALHALADHHAGDVRADANERGVAERDHAAVAEDEVEARRGDPEDDDAAREAQVEVEAERAQHEGQGERDERGDGDRQRANGGAHQPRAGNRPCGLIARTTAMKT